MTNSKQTRRALLSSTVAILMCVAMLIGTTFAWFTDKAVASVNTIQSGTLDVVLEKYDTATNSWVDAEGTTLDFQPTDGRATILWEPNCRYELPKLRIRNNGTLALNYSVQITGLTGDAILNEVITWDFGGMQDGFLKAGEQTNEFVISAHMAADADNRYQDKKIENIAITVYATQASYENDSDGNQYDANAPFTSFWDGTTTTPVTAVNGTYTVKSAAELMYLMNNAQSGSSRYYGESIVLDCDIDLGGATVKGFGNEGCIFAGSFDGQGHTISNFKIDRKPATPNTKYYAGLFNYYSRGTLENLTVKNATVVGDQMAGVLVGSLDANAIVRNCVVENSTVVGYRKVGGAIGYASDATINNCDVKNTNVYCAVAVQSHGKDQWGAIIGYKNAGLAESGNDATNVNVNTNAITVSNAAEFAALQTKTAMTNIVILNNIDMTGTAWNGLLGGTMGTNAAYAGITIDGNGHTVSGLTAPIIAGTTYNATIKNLTVADSEIADCASNAAAGAFIAYADSEDSCVIALENCKLKSSTVGNGNANYAGGFIGMFTGKTLTVSNCEIASDCTVKGNKNVGGIVGFCQTTASEQKVANCTVGNGVTLNGGIHRGVIAGTVNRNYTFNINNCTYDPAANVVGRIVDANVVIG